MALEQKNIEYVRLGNSGLKIAPVVVGCMSYGTPEWAGWVLDEEASLPLLEHAYKSGLNTWDTADIYSHGQSERIVAKALKQYNIPRENVVLLSKCYFGVSSDGAQLPIAQVQENRGAMVNRVGLSRKHILDAVDASVARLGTYIDVLQIHRLDRDTPKEEIMRALNDVVESGKVRYIGASSMYAWEFQMLQSIAEKNGWHKFISMQNYLNLTYREEEREMIPYCKATGVGLIPWSPIARGMLARPWNDRGSSRETTDNYLKNFLRGKYTETDKMIVDRVEELAKKRGVPMATIAQAWVMRQGAFPIIGMNKKERIDEAIEGIKFELSDEEAKHLEEPYIPKPIFGH